MKLLKSEHLDRIMEATGLSEDEILHRLVTPQGWPLRNIEHVESFRPWEQAQPILGLTEELHDDYDALQFTSNDDGCDYCGSLELSNDRISRKTIVGHCRRCGQVTTFESDILPEHENKYPH